LWYVYKEQRIANPAKETSINKNNLGSKIISGININSDTRATKGDMLTLLI